MIPTHVTKLLLTRRQHISRLAVGNVIFNVVRDVTSGAIDGIDV